LDAAAVTSNADYETPRQRPKWTEAIRVFIADTVIDDEYGFPDDGSDDALSDEIELAVNTILCNAYGHDVIDDHCMIPGHRFCVYCNRRATDLPPNDGSGAPA
jgi:hypothetical protein